MPQLTNSVDERQILTWLESVTGDEFSNKTIQEALKDGTILCKAFNNLFPQYKVKWAASSMPFKQMENIAAFLKGVSQVPGIRSFDLFMTVDLFEAKNLEQVKRCLVSWKRTAEKNGNSLFSPVREQEPIEKNEASLFSPVKEQELIEKNETSLFSPAKEQDPIAQSEPVQCNQQTKPESPVSESGFEASRSNSFQSFEAMDVDEQVQPSAIEEAEEEIEISFVEPEVILPPESPIENNFADIDEPVIECVAE